MSKKEKKGCAPRECRRTSIGGQALIEGIMMRGPDKTAMAVRDPEGKMVLEVSNTQKKKRPKILKLPIIRGVVGFIDSMTVGYKSLMRSAEIAGLEEGEDEKESRKWQTVLTVVGAIAMVIGVALAVVLFIGLPTFLYSWLVRLVPALEPEDPVWRSLVKSVFEGVLKIAVLVGYMSLVSLMKDIKRTFQYHGAEHKTIFCYEHGKELTVENVKGEGRFHPRCGTSFLILMLLVGIFVSFFIDPLFLLTMGAVPRPIIRTAIRLLLLPIIMGLGYELIKLAGKHNNAFTRVISAPGMWLQHITVLEPDDQMIECAIAAFVEVMPENERPAKNEETHRSTDGTDTDADKNE